MVGKDPRSCIVPCEVFAGSHSINIYHHSRTISRRWKDFKHPTLRQLRFANTAEMAGRRRVQAMWTVALHFCDMGSWKLSIISRGKMIACEGGQGMNFDCSLLTGSGYACTCTYSPLGMLDWVFARLELPRGVLMTLNRNIRAACEAQ
jgi:hypothetical protein